MNYFEILNDLENVNLENGIFLNMEYLENGKVKRNNLLEVTKPFFHIL